MCGITGSVENKVNPKITAEMAGLIKHRGPNEGPIVVYNKNVSIGAVRLSIVDVSHGTQPMFDNKGNIVALNGEIYNYKQLLSALQKDGYDFKTHCDTEVLLAGFNFYGPNFVKKLDGIFSISYYSSTRKKLYLFRDHFGVKPLYFTKNNKGIFFASEIKSFWLLRRNYLVNQDYIIYNQVFGWSNPNQTLYSDIRSVAPSSYLVIDMNQSMKAIRYEPQVTFKKIKTFKEAISETRLRLKKAIEMQIPEEVDWAVLLSGGVDSSILAWNANKFSRKPIKTFSISSSETDTEDLIHARKVAIDIGSEHTEIRVNIKDAKKYYSDYLYSIEDINSRFYFYYFLSKHISQKVRVALCGEGSDELYMGYPIYRNMKDYINSIDHKWKKLKKFYIGNPKEITKIIKQLKIKGLESLYELMLTNQMPYFQLNPVDKCSMRFGLELRVPYLSLYHSLAVQKYPKKEHISYSIEKKILREAFKQSKLHTINRKKFFAGTRTLPTFYKELSKMAKKNAPTLKVKYKTLGKIMNEKDLYSFSLIHTKMKEKKKPYKGIIHYIHI